MTNKKIRLPLFIAASFLLIGCSSDTIVARPTGWANDKIFVEAGDKDNKMKNIYDAIKNLGDTNASVLTKVMYNIAKNNIGKFVADDNNDKDLTLRDIYYNSEDNAKYYEDETFQKFVDSHPIYKAETTSAYFDSEANETKTKQIIGIDKYKVSLKKIINQFKLIRENIYEKLFDDIKGGTYSEGDSKIFNEKLYYRHLRAELYYPTEGWTDFVANKAFFVKDKEDNQSWQDYVDVVSCKHGTENGGYLHVMKEDAGGTKVSRETTGIYDNYIKNKILPELYKTYLTQTYVKEQRSSSLGRSYARKVNMVTIPKGTGVQADKVLNMANYFAKTYITGSKLGDIPVNCNFELLNKAMSGFVGKDSSDEVYQLLTNTPTTSYNFNKVQFKGVDKKDYNFEWRCFTDENGNPSYDESGNPTGTLITHVFSGTKLGDLVEKYQKLYDFTHKTESDNDRNFTVTEKEKYDEDAIKAYDDITNNGSYSVAVGMAIKEKEARLLDMTKDGWFLKNGGLTDLDADFRNNLFNISTSTNIDDIDKIKNLNNFKQGDYVRYFGEKDEVTSREDMAKRKAFLTTTTGSSDLWTSIVLIGTSNIYIVEVEEAISTSKMSIATNSNSYYRLKAAKDDAVETADIVDKLSKKVVIANASSDTYKKNANEYYLMISNIVFYDQSVYDYFKSQFPDLFK